MKPPLLLVRNLTKTFANGAFVIPVLKSISLNVDRGQFVSIIGPSGCGKSTFFNILCGVEKETSGSIVLSGQENHKRKGSFGYMPQKPLLLPWRTVLENIMLGLDIKNDDRIDAKQKAHTLLTKFGLAQFAGVYPDKLSGGMAQKVALLRTALFHHSFLLLDEPFGALDALTRSSLQVWLSHIWQEYKMSVLFVTHDIREAIFLSDFIYVFSPRPAEIIEEIAVTLPRPRRRSHLTGTKALQLEKHLEELLLKEKAL